MQEKMRNILGVAFYQADQPLSALEQHKLCQEAVQNGVVTDPNFKLMVYSNLANDYWALHDNEHAMATYKTALELLGDVNSIEKQAAIFWKRATNQSLGIEASTCKPTPWLPARHSACTRRWTISGW